MDGIFVSYRRGPGASAAAGRLADRLVQRFGRNRVFMDVDTVRPGQDFVDAIDRSVASCTALVAVIDPGWASERGGHRRIDEPGDYVRLEVAAALRRGISVIPVLVLGAQMPRGEDLPPDLAPLSRRQALALSHERFNRDVEVLVDELGGATKRARSAPVDPTQSAWTTPAVRGTVGVVLTLAAGIAWIVALAYERAQEGQDTLGWHPYVTDVYVVPLRVIAVVTLGVLAIFLLSTRPKR